MNALDIEMEKKKIVINQATGRMERITNTMDMSKSKFGFKMEDIPDYDKTVKEKDTPMQTLVKRFEECGWTVEQAFDIFDDNGDGVLTVKEIREGFKNEELNVQDSEVQALVNIIDADTNGVVSLPEWVTVLKPKLEAEKDFRAIMCNVNIDDPIDLEEKTLDLRYRIKHLQSELVLLQRTNGEGGNRVRGKQLS